MKEFNLVEAISGAEVCTKAGHKVRIICWDSKIKDYPIVALETMDDGEETIGEYTLNGQFTIWEKEDPIFDLMMVD